MGPGAPGGIRTRDLHLERVASWASRRRGPVGIVAARRANSGVYRYARAPFAPRHRQIRSRRGADGRKVWWWRRKTWRRGIGRANRAASRLLRAGVARRYGGRDGRCRGGRRDNGVLVEDARERGLQDAVLVAASPDDGAGADRFLRAREISGRGHTNGAEIHRPDCSVEFRDRHVQPDEAGVIGRLDAGVGLDLEIAAVAGEVDEEKGAFEGLRRTLRRDDLEAGHVPDSASRPVENTDQRRGVRRRVRGEDGNLVCEELLILPGGFDENTGAALGLAGGGIDGGVGVNGEREAADFPFIRRLLDIALDDAFERELRGRFLLVAGGRGRCDRPDLRCDDTR